MKCKVKTKKIVEKDEDLAAMFNQMLGAGDCDLKIAFPRYQRMHSLYEKVIEIFTVLRDSKITPDNHKQELNKWILQAQANVNYYFAVNLDITNLNGVSEEDKKDFNTRYAKVKTIGTTNDIIMFCDRLVPFRKNFEDVDQLKYKFILRLPGAGWMPFEGATTFNFQHFLEQPNLSPAVIHFVMIIISKMFMLTYAMWEELNSPDIDVAAFVDLIINNLAKVQQIPELHRCKKAFSKIKESVHLLKNNFNEYYRDFISTKDSTIILQHFVLDVSKDSDADPVLTNQFRTIINYYRKVAKQQTTQNPKVKALFEQVDRQFEQMESKTKNLGKKNAGSPAADDNHQEDEEETALGEKL